MVCWLFRPVLYCNRYPLLTHCSGYVLVNPWFVVRSLLATDFNEQALTQSNPDE